MKLRVDRLLISNEERVQERPQVSRAIHSPAGLGWLNAISQSNMVVSAILAVINPELYEAGWKTFMHLRKDTEFQRQDIHHVLNQWTSAFSGVSIMRNRITPLHRDGSSRHHWYDLLVTLGDYQKCDFELPGLGVLLEYGPGTVVGLSGMVLQHEVANFEGERECYAYFMRNDVHGWANVPASDWMKQKYYQ